MRRIYYRGEESGKKIKAISCELSKRQRRIYYRGEESGKKIKAISCELSAKSAE